MEYYGALHYQSSFWKIIRHLTLILTYFCLVTLETAAMQLRSPARGDDDETKKRPRTSSALAMRFASRVPQAIHYGRNFQIFSNNYETYASYQIKNDQSKA